MLWTLWALAMAQERPELSGPVETVDSADGAFRVHFTREGGDAPEPGGSGVPEFVAGVLRGLEEGRSAFEARGYRALADDDGAGGSPAIDVYIRDLDINGYARGWQAADGVEGSSCWMEVDSFLDLGRVPDSVAAHELHHCVEFRYTTEAASWITEATATFEQYLTLTDPALELALDFLWRTRLQGAERPLDDVGDRFEYAGFSFVKFWEDLATEPGAIHRMWEALAEEPRWRPGLELAAQREFGLSFAEVFATFATWNAFACDRDDGQHYSDTLSCGLVGIGVPIQEADAGALSIVHDGEGFTTSYTAAPAQGEAMALSCDVGGREMALQLVARDATGARTAVQHAEPVDGRVDVQVSVVEGGDVLVVAVSLERRPLSADCTLATAEVETEACGCRSAQAGWLALLALPWVRRRAGSRGGRGARRAPR